MLFKNISVGTKYKIAGEEELITTYMKIRIPYSEESLFNCVEIWGVHMGVPDFCAADVEVLEVILDFRKVLAK